MLTDPVIPLVGHVGADVTLRQAGDSAVANVRVACTPRRYRRATDEWVDGETQWYTVNAWRQLAEHCARSLRRGDPVVVHGRLQTRSYVNREGHDVLTHEVEALTVGHDLCRGTSSFARRPSAPRQEQHAPQDQSEQVATVDDVVTAQREAPAA